MLRSIARSLSFRAGGLFRPAVLFAVMLHGASDLPAQDTTASPGMKDGGVDSALVVEEVVVTGNDLTRDFVILREMQLSPGETVTQDKIEYDRERVYSLRLFNRVLIEVVPLGGGRARLVVDVDERWYIFPFPILGIKDRDWGKVFYGAGIVHNNFRGRAEKLFASFILGYDPAVSLYYKNSFLDDAGTYFMDARLSYGNVRNRSPLAESTFGEYVERHFSLTASAGRRLNRYHALWITAGYRHVTVPNRSTITTISGEGQDNFPVTGAGYSFDTRDLREYPSTGTMITVTYSKYGLPGGDVDFSRFATDFRQFVPLPAGITVAGRVFTDHGLGGTIPSYSRVYFGYGERIRGHFDEVIEGEHLAGATAELRIPVLSPRYLMVPMLPRGFDVWRFGVTAAVFADAGRTWFRDEKFSLGDMKKGYGAGIHLLLPYSAILRLEYAWDEQRNGEFIVDLGAAL